ncbi:MAG: CHAT domain-containing protein [Dehalococcoidia bacterium]|nr:CHAT domain-containing protein [Dehalococcoidia bacterium]
MSISQSRMEDWRCTYCGEATPRLTWLAVDARERPDLIAGFSNLVKMECPNCYRPVRRSQPLLVLRLAKAAPLIAAQADDDQRDPFESLGDVVATVRSELGDALREVPGLAVRVTFDEIEVGAERNIDVDVGALSTDASRSGRHDSTYRGLLSKVRGSQQEQRLQAGLQELALVGSEEQLREVVERWPEIVTDTAESLVNEHLEQATTEEGRHFATSMVHTVQLCRSGDFAGAWSVREAVIRRFQEDTFRPRLRAFEDARRADQPTHLARAGTALLEVLPPGTDPDLRSAVAGLTAAALLTDEGPDRSRSIERAIELGQMVFSILDQHPEVDDPPRRLATATNLSAAFGMRPLGDPAWNLSQGIAYLTEALDRFPPTLDLDSWAMAHTDLALLLVNRGQSGDYDQARHHLELALTHRSLHRDPQDWAFTQLNLAVAYSRTDTGDGQANLRKAIWHSARGRYGARSAGDVPLLAQAEHNLAAQQFQLSRMTDSTPAHRSRLLDRAEASALESARLSPADQSPLRFGHAWTMVGKIRAARKERGGAIEAFKAALTALSADMGPSEAREASRLLLELAEAEDHVELAADAAGRLVEAAAAVISAHSRADDRMSEHSWQGTTDFRFAAHALVRAGRLEEAVMALELGRTRELGLLMLGESIDLDALSHIDPSLHAEVEELVAEVRADILSPKEGSTSDRSERFARIRAALRQTPTFEKAFPPPTLDEVGVAAEPQCPVVYLGSAPKGSYCIIVYSDGHGSTSLEAIHAADCDSQAIADLAIGLAPDGTQVSDIAYLAAQAYEPELLDESIRLLSPLIGAKLLRPLADSLARRGVSSVTLIPAGILGLMPLHGISWSDAEGSRKALIDDFDVRFAASARLQLACTQRAHKYGNAVRFLGVANPLPHSSPLDGADLEVDLIESFLPAGNHLVLEGEQATKRRVLDALPSATHVHFACHGGGRFFDPLLSAALSLSDEEPLSAREVAGLEISARLVVASACETGVLQGYFEVDESLGLASAFVAAGAAGVVSTLWQVDDLATALIMSKFYEGILGAGMEPAAALREAQLWMRAADAATINAYASAREPLRVMRSRSQSAIASGDSAPFNAPSFWAAFVFTGA